VAACTSQTESSGGEHSATAEAFPEHLCDSGISTAPLTRIYPEGSSGPFQMAPDNRSTGSIHNFLDKEKKTGSWICSMQFTGKNAESSLFTATIMAVAKDRTSLLEPVIRGAGYHPHSLSLGVMQGVNGPRRSALAFPCQMNEHTKVTMFVRLFHPIDRDAADARREHVVRTSSGFIQDLARYVLDTLHLCKNLPGFPSGKFKTEPISK